jgi:hypothetical protein
MSQPLRVVRQEERKRFFLKKEAKTFYYFAYALPQRVRYMSKSFLVLFFKKELLAFPVFAPSPNP